MAPPSLSAARVAVGLRLFILGVLDAAWWSQIALVSHDLRLGPGALSVALAGAPVGLLAAMRLVAPLVARSSSAVVLGRAILLSALALLLIGLAGSVVALTAALVVFGLANGVIDVAVNVQAVALERLMGRAIMSRLHAMWSFGTLLGALAGAGAISLGSDPLGYLTAVAAVLVLLGRFRAGGLLDVVADAPATSPASSTARPRLAREPGLVALGVIAFCGLFAEGAVSNWGGVLLHQVRHASFTVAALASAGFGAGMLIGRLGGDAVIARAGRRRVLMIAGPAGAVALTLATLLPSVAAALLALLALGTLLGTIVPTAFSLTAGVPGPPPAWTISRLTTIGYVGSFASPVLIGVIAGASRLTVALLLPALLLLIVWPAARATRARLDPAALAR